jgi:hypothetical protein
MMSHAMLPTPLQVPNGIRVYFTACDSDLRGRIFYAELDDNFPFEVRHICIEPVLHLGEPGAFDADGVNPSHLVERDGKIYLYYIGWQRVSVEVPYKLLAGLAVSVDGGLNFDRVHDYPLLPSNDEEPYFRTAPFVWLEDGQWQMLYIGGGEFFDSPSGKRLPRYSLRHLVSDDGLHWPGRSRTLLEPDPSKGQIGFGRPVVLFGDEKALMISVRTVDGYRLQHCPFRLASSVDSSKLSDVLPLTRQHWDAQMTCFGVRLELDEGQLLFYNGNRFGESGFGLAWHPSPVSQVKQAILERNGDLEDRVLN